jgi:hypothetical protein
MASSRGSSRLSCCSRCCAMRRSALEGMGVIYQL